MPTVNYKWPVSGTTAPTALQASQVSTINAQVVLADADTVAVVTHNWNLSAADLAAYFPIVSSFVEGSGTGGAILATILTTLTNSVAVTISKVSTAAGTAQTLVVSLSRPHSIER